MDKTKVFGLLKEPSTYAGMGLLIAALLGLPAMSGEQIGVIIAGILSMIIPESKTTE